MRIHIGLDYGTSASKLVIRNYNAPGGEKSWLVPNGNDFRFTSTVRYHNGRLFFLGSADGPGQVLRSIKMLVAAEVTGDYRYWHGRRVQLPEGITALDLACITVARLLERAKLAVNSRLAWDHGAAEAGRLQLQFGTTLGVPMSFMACDKLRAAFLKIARVAWRLWRSSVLRKDFVDKNNVRTILDRLYADIDNNPIPNERVPDWIRSEAEASMLWPYYSPAVAAGPYLRVDVGAGTTNTSVFRITNTMVGQQWVQDKLAFFGSSCTPYGMDAIDAGLAAYRGEPGREHHLRNQEEHALQDPRALEACEDAFKGICASVTGAWQQAWEGFYRVQPERDSWRQTAKMFITGGGSTVSAVRQRVRVRPRHLEYRDALIAQMQNEWPHDLEEVEGRGDALLPFLSVAYGLSHVGMAIPRALRPDEIPPLQAREERLRRLDHEDLYPR